jgi:transcriptional regulator with XRE-family HTH domain
VRDIEAELLEEIEAAMRRTGQTQADFAAHRGVSRQSVNPYFNGKRSLLTETGRELLVFLGLRIRLEPLEPPVS